MRGWGKKGPDNPERSQATKLLEECSLNLLAAFRSLASAGEPRVPKAHRAKHIESAARLTDRIRTDLSQARLCFAHCQLRLERRTADKRAEPHDQAAVTVLTPLVKTMTGQTQALGTLLLHYQGTSRRPADSAERREADHFRSSWSDDGQRHRCNWCGKVEPDKWLKHYPLDRDGFVIARKDAVRFACAQCFDEGKDLAEPAPKALPAALPLESDAVPETVECVPTPQPLLPDNAAALEGCHGSC